MYRLINKIILFLLALIVIPQVSAQSGNEDIEKQRKFDNFFYDAMIAKSKGEYSQAFDLLNYCLRMDSTNANLLYELGIFHNSLEDKDKSLTFHRKAVDIDSTNYYYVLSLATLSLEMDHHEDAIYFFTKLINEYPGDNDLYLYLSEAYRLSGDIPQAIEALDKLENIVGLNDKLTLQKFRLYGLLDQKEEAYDEIKRYIEKYPSEIRYQVLLGNLYMESGDYDKAFLLFSKVKAANPEDPYLITAMTAYYEKTNNRDAAENEMQTALKSPKIEISTKLGMLAQYVSTLHENKKETTTANALFDTLLVLHPQEPNLNLMYGNLLMMQNNKNEARFHYQIYTEANPTNPIGWEQLIATTFPDSTKITKEVCLRAIEYLPEAPQFYFYLGGSEYLLGQYEDALETFRKGVKVVDPANVYLISDFYGQIGDLYYQIEQPDSAFVYYEKALKHNSKNLGVLNNYSYFLSLQKENMDKAEKMSEITVKEEPSNPTYLDTYGWILFQQKMYVIAKLYIENAIKYSREQGVEISGEVYEHYGDVLFKTGDETKAVEYWIKAKEVETDEPRENRRSKTLDKKIETKTYIEEE